MINLLLAPICFCTDQITKRRALKKYKDGSQRYLFKDFIRLKIVYNKGAFLGLLSSKPKLLGIIQFVTYIGLVFTTIGSFIFRGGQLLKMGLSLMTGGASGNLYDRVKRKKVVDFISFKPIKNVYFNFADFFVFIGTFFVLIHSLFQSKK